MTFGCLFTFLTYEFSFAPNDCLLAIVCLTLSRSFLLDNTWTFLHFDIFGPVKDSQFGSGLMDPTNMTVDCRETENTFFFFFLPLMAK